jgi:hypothetical protein
MLEGFYWKVSSPGILDDMKKMTVINLSLGGCCLNVSSVNAPNLYDQIKLVFNLDNANRTRIKMEAAVCWITGNQIGCKFSEKITGYEPELVSYINEHINDVV